MASSGFLLRLRKSCSQNHPGNLLLCLTGPQRLRSTYPSTSQCQGGGGITFIVVQVHPLSWSEVHPLDNSHAFR